MSELFPIEKTDILHFSREKNKRVPIKNCEIVSNFLFCKFEFFLLHKNKMFFICFLSNRELFLVWKKSEYSNGNKLLPGEILSEFRKLFLKNKINKDKIDLFIADPLTYEKQYKKKKM